MATTLKLIVSADVTSVAQMRIKYCDRDYTNFCCGVDLHGDIVTANSPSVYGRTFAELAENVVEVSKYRGANDFQNLKDIEYILFCDDSQVLVLGDYEDVADYQRDADEAHRNCSNEILPHLPKLIRNLSWNKEEAQWEGTVEIIDRRMF